mgnify:CR=1 FL=1
MATESLTVSAAAGPHKSGSSSRVWFGSDRSNAKYYVTELSFTIPEACIIDVWNPYSLAFHDK